VIAHSAGEGRGSEFVVKLPLGEPGTAVVTSERQRDRDEPQRDAQKDAQRDKERHKVSLHTAAAVDGNGHHNGNGAPGALEPGSRSAGVAQAELPGPVLLVEDNVDSREMLCELLHLSGVACTAVDSGAAALASLGGLNPYAAVVDLGLPVMDGFELARRIRALPAHGRMRLIALTGYGQPSDRARSRQAGFDEHLVKPVRIDQLLAALRRRSAPTADHHGASGGDSHGRAAFTG